MLYLVDHILLERITLLNLSIMILKKPIFRAR